MPCCVLGDHCQHPSLDLRESHKCRQCHHIVHVLCAEEDPNAESSSNLTCFLCTTPPKVQHPRSSHAYEKEVIPSPPQNATMQSTQNTANLPSTKAVASKQTSALKGTSSRTKRKAPTNNRTSKAKISKDFRLDADKSKPDPLLMKTVVFDVDDKSHGTRLYNHFGGEENAKKSLTIRNGKRILLGTVIRQTNTKKSPQGSSSTIRYDIQWEDSTLGDTPVDVTLIYDAIALHKAIFSPKNTKHPKHPPAARQSRNRDPFSPELRTMLFSVDEIERGHPNSSDDDDSTNPDEDEEDYFFFHQKPFDNYPSEGLDENDNLEEGNIHGLTSSNFRWSSGNLQAPPDRSQRCGSHVTPQLTAHFETPIQSLLAFIPLRIFNSIAYFSNLYANDAITKSENGTISGAKWENDITINEIMKFFGILFKMVLRPTPGQPYPYCWNDPSWHPYTAYMKLRRFQQIRSVLHFNDNASMDGSNDAVFKVSSTLIHMILSIPLTQYPLFVSWQVRPLLNCLKNTFPLYLELGDEVSLDEASVSSRSRYGSDVIFYNPRKPGGKFHFRFYLMCCSSTYACIRIRIHTKNRSDVADAPPSPGPPPRNHQSKNKVLFPDQSQHMHSTRAGPKTTGLLEDDKTDENDDSSDRIEVDDESSELVRTDDAKDVGPTLLSLIMDMCEPLFGSGRVVNMDNYYTSPTAAWMLLKEKVYMRGTCRNNRIGFPNGVMFSSKEKKQWERGSIRRMVERNKRIAAFGWLDGNPVHFITTADGSGMTTVKRRVGRERKTVEAPIGIKQYNKGMQAVDRHDQLRQGLSLASRHGFKKYYQKIALGLIDMAVVNAWIHYKLVNPGKCSHERARYEFMDSIADSLILFNWQQYKESATSEERIDVLRVLTQDKRPGMKQKNIANHDERFVAPNLEDTGGTLNRCTPIAVQQLMSGMRSKKKGLSCQVCSFEGRGGNIISHVVACVQHRVRACTIIRETKTLEKENGSQVTDYSWRAPMVDASCWDKIHRFYIPKGLFRDDVSPMPTDSNKITFQCCCIGSSLYKKKKEALGETHSRRGRKPQTHDVDASDTFYDAMEMEFHEV